MHFGRIYKLRPCKNQIIWETTLLQTCYQRFIHVQERRPFIITGFITNKSSIQFFLAGSCCDGFFGKILLVSTYCTLDICLEYYFVVFASLNSTVNINEAQQRLFMIDNLYHNDQICYSALPYQTNHLICLRINLKLTSVLKSLSEVGVSAVRMVWRSRQFDANHLL